LTTAADGGKGAGGAGGGSGEPSWSGIAMGHGARENSRVSESPLTPSV